MVKFAYKHYKLVFVLSTALSTRHNRLVSALLSIPSLKQTKTLTVCGERN